jgi:hypothetical protein
MLRDALRAGEPVLYMDADALYDWRLLDRLLGSAHADCVLIARGDPDPEWLEVRIRNDRIVAFDKGVTRPEYDIRAEWVGFARFRVATAARFAGAIERYVARGEVDLIYEKPMRDVILATGAFAFEDIPTTSHGVAPRARLRHRAQWAARAAARQAGLSDPASEQAIPRRRRHAHRPALGSAPRQSVAEASEGGVDHA